MLRSHRTCSCMSLVISIHPDFVGTLDPLGPPAGMVTPHFQLFTLHSGLAQAMLRSYRTRTCFHGDVIDSRFGIEFLDHKVVVSFNDLDIL